MSHVDDMVKEALSTVTGPRREKYGKPSDNHTRTALLFNAYLRTLGTDRINAKDVCVFNILQKISRGVHNGFDEDTIMDIIGYALNITDINNE